ncbi:50S ribosomal protein L22 [Candidatus Woesearchaeota archaeon]|nr:50S ribosomal protein L22 [Candidatus Woesearchaeota archaeon]
MVNKLTYENLQENMAFAKGLNLSISTKKAVEICNNIRKKPVTEAKKILEEIIELKRPLPMKRFNRDTAHKKAIGPGRFPKKTAKLILSTVKNAESNAQNKGLNTHNLIIAHISAHKASTPWHYGRHRRRKMKRTHVEIVVEEKKPEKDKQDKTKQR